MLYLEWKKILIKQKGLLIIGLMVLLKFVMTLQLGYDSNEIINRNPDTYTTYMNFFEGKMTEEKEQALKDEYYAITNANVELDALVRKWKDGELEKKTY